MERTGRDAGTGRREGASDACVVGGGPAGLVAAILLARAGLAVRLFAPPPPAGDTRTSALMRGSVALLDALGVWPRIADKAAPLAHMRIVDATGRLLRAPEVVFDAAEIGEPAFGSNVRNRDLLAALDRLARRTQGLTPDARAVAALRPGAELAELVAADGERIPARLVVAADGRNSLCRRAAGIAVRETRYPQTALAFDIGHELAHGDVSTEFHTDSGPLTFVPLPGAQSSVVWVVRPDEAAALLALDEAAFAARLEERCFSFLGRLGPVGPRGAFPLSAMTAQRMAARRVALIGEAGHVVPPIGAQGLNLGLRDAAALAETVAEARAAGTDIGADATLARYADWRRADIASRATGIDLLNRSVLSDFLPVQLARGAGLYLLGRVGPLRRFAMAAGMEPPGRQPRIMRPRRNGRSSGGTF